MKQIVNFNLACLVLGRFYRADEWVILLPGEASLAYADGSKIKLTAGDYLLIPAHQKHRVEYTSSEPPCIWLAVHAHLVPLRESNKDLLQ